MNDTFTRETGNGWGSANTGGAYTAAGNSSSLSVDGSAGHMLISMVGQSRGALINSVSKRDVDIRFKVSTDKPAANGKFYVYGVARKIGTSEYRPRLIFNSNGTVQVGASMLVNGTEQQIGSAVTVAGLSQSQPIMFRAMVTGANPTTIKVKAWQAGSAEPSTWQFTATNSSAGLQAAGTLGIRIFVSAAVTNAPIDFKFDDYKVIAQ